jgi:hypothetical protein
MDPSSERFCYISPVAVECSWLKNNNLWYVSVVVWYQTDFGFQDSTTVKFRERLDGCFCHRCWTRSSAYSVAGRSVAIVSEVTSPGLWFDDDRRTHQTVRCREG